MEHENENRPFLEYTDDPANSGETGSSSGAVTTPAAKKAAARRRSRLARDVVVFFAASLLWLGGMFFLMPYSSTTAWSGAAHKHPAAIGGGEKIDYRLHNVTSNAHFVTCGNSTVEARRSGCRYDPLLNHWVPMECVDQEWIEEYQGDDSWTAFAEYVSLFAKWRSKTTDIVK